MEIHGIPCGKRPAYTMEELIRMALSKGASGGEGYNFYCVDEIGEIVSGQRIDTTEFGDSADSADKIWYVNVGCRDQNGEQYLWGDDPDQICVDCLWYCGVYGGWGDFRATVVLDEKVVDSYADCGADVFANDSRQSAQSIQEDELI